MLDRRGLRMNSRHSLLLLVAVLCSWVSVSQAASPLRQTFSPVDDAHVRSGFAFAKKNFGHDTVLELQNTKNSVSEAYLKFDLVGIDRNIKEARLRLHVSADNPDPTVIELRTLGSSAWIENTVTWKQKPEPLSVIGTFQTVGSSGAWYEVDLTTHLKRELAGGNDTLNLALTIGDGSSNRILIRSREADANGPEIFVSRGRFAAKIVFQPKTKPAPSGYLVDSGEPFGPRETSGLSFGWSADVTKYVRDRNAPPAEDEPKPTKAPDARYMGVAFMDHADMKAPATWEIAVPNGKYKLHVVAGDASYYDSIFALNVEDVLTVDGIPDANKRWVEGAQIIAVSDGRLTLKNHTKGINNKLCFLEIAEVAGP